MDERLAEVSTIRLKPKDLSHPLAHRGLAGAITLVAMMAGCLTSLHLLGLINLLIGWPIISPRAVVLTVAAGIFCAMLLRRRIGLKGEREAVQGRDCSVPRVAKIIVALVTVPYVARFLDTLWSFPNGYDAIAYHIDVALKWLQNGTMGVNPASGWKYALPSNAELPALVVLSLGLPKAVAIGNLFAAVLLGAAIYLIAFGLTARPTPSLLAAAVAVTVPMVIYQAFELNVDLFGAAFLTMAIALLIWREQNQPACMFLSGYAAGVAVGTKPVFWVYVVLLVATALAVLVFSRTARIEVARWRANWIVLVLVGVLLPSSFWFFRSAVATGNPFYPMGVTVGGYEILPGYARTDMTSLSSISGSQRLRLLLQPWLEKRPDDGLPVGYDRGTGPLFAAQAIPGVLFMVIQVIRRRRASLLGVMLVALLLTMAAAALILWDGALLRVPRFSLPIIALACALAAPMLQLLFDESRRLLVAVFLAGVSMNTLYCLAEPAQRIARRVHRGDWSRATYYGYPSIIDRLPAGSRIAHRTDLTFLFAGSELQHYVLPNGDIRDADYVVKIGPCDEEDLALHSIGSALLYDATPPSLYPKVERPWRIYRLR